MYNITKVIAENIYTGKTSFNTRHYKDVVGIEYRTGGGFDVVTLKFGDRTSMETSFPSDKFVIHCIYTEDGEE